MIKIGIFGGTFDPIHNGHIEIAKTCRKNLGLKEVWFVPSFSQPQKTNVTPYNTRVQMVKKGIEPYHHFKCKELEKNQEPSYTYNTVNKLLKRYKSYKFYLIVGPDQYDNLKNWYKIEELEKLIDIVVMGDKKDDNHIFIPFNSTIRSTQAKQGDLNIVPKGVDKIIISKHLYFDTIMQAHMSEKRYKHSLSVKDTAIQIAKMHGIDLDKVYIAAMFHDITKEMDKEEATKIMQYYYPKYVDYRPTIYHEFTAMNFLKENLHISDSQIINAIGHHVIGDSKSPIAQIIFIADKIEPTRGYDNTKHLEAARRSLHEGVAYVKKEQKEYLEKVEGINV